jgi:hypothetical protein
MKLRNLTFIALALLGTASPVHAQIAQATEPPVASDVEEIYIARSVREARMMPTEFCAKARTGVDNATVEDQLTFRSLATRTSDGRVLDTNLKTIGSVHACQGPTANPAISQFYGDFVLERIAFKGFGECHRAKSDFPERGVTVFSCVFDLSGLPGEYIGGLLTTNTISSLKILGTETEPSGYTQASIATIRLWKKRDGR